MNSKRILIVTAVSTEAKAISLGLQEVNNFDVISAGVGPVAAAVATTRELAEKRYDLVISAGIGGGFIGQADIGTVVVANAIIAADLGVGTPDGFRNLGELTKTYIPVKMELVNPLVDGLSAAGLSVITGPVLTVSTVTGTAESADSLQSRVPGAVAEAMEGFGVASAAEAYGLPCIEIRTISNAVGPRDKASWRIEEALEKLTAASTVLQEVLNEDRIFSMSE